MSNLTLPVSGFNVVTDVCISDRRELSERFSPNIPLLIKVNKFDIFLMTIDHPSFIKLLLCQQTIVRLTPELLS